jgi:hypothetical protein
MSRELHGHSVLFLLQAKKSFQSMTATKSAVMPNGFRRVITDTDAKSFTDSTRLYKGLGMQPYQSEFTYEKEIRPGKEVRRLAM